MPLSRELLDMKTSLASIQKITHHYLLLKPIEPMLCPHHKRKVILFLRSQLVIASRRDAYIVPEGNKDKLINSLNNFQSVKLSHCLLLLVVLDMEPGDLHTLSILAQGSTPVPNFKACICSPFLPCPLVCSYERTD